MTENYIAATTAGGLEDQVSPVFGRTPTFTVVEVREGKIVGASVVPNPYLKNAQGAGVQAAQFVAEKGPRAVFAGNFGPGAAGVLAQAGIEIVLVSGRTVRQAVEDYLAGRLAPSPAPAGGFGPPMGRGRGGLTSPGPLDVEALRERLSRLEAELAEVKKKLSELKGGE